MPICPKCNKPVEELLSESMAYRDVTLDEDSLEISSMVRAEVDLEVYECPNCTEVVATSKQGAIDFLRG